MCLNKHSDGLSAREREHGHKFVDRVVGEPILCEVDDLGLEFSALREGDHLRVAVQLAGLRRLLLAGLQDAREHAPVWIELYANVLLTFG